MNHQANEQVAQTPIDWSPEHFRDTGKVFWARILERLVAWSERRAATIIYVELCKLSDAELERRGFARGDLHRQVFES
jgi:hypothetical protein